MSNSTSFTQRCNFSEVPASVIYDGSGFQKTVQHLMEQIQREAPMVYDFLARQHLPPFSPHNELCLYKTKSKDDDESGVPVSRNVGIIMVTEATAENVTEKFASEKSSSSSADVVPDPKAKEDRRSSSGHALFGSYGLVHDEEDEVKTHGAYFIGDPFGVKRCRVMLDDHNEVVLHEYTFGLALKSVCALIIQYLSQKMKNHLNTNEDFKTASVVGRPDVMILIARLMDISNLSSITKKNMLNANSFTMLRKFLVIQQDGQSLALYEKRFMDQLAAINSMGAMFSSVKEVQLLLNNLWGQLWYSGLSPDYNKMKVRMLERDELQYPEATLTTAVEKSKVFYGHLESSNHVFGNKSKVVTANAVASDASSNPPADTSVSKKSGAKDRKQLADQKAAAVAVARVKFQAEFDARYAVLQSKYDKAVRPESKPLCAICGYNKGHNTFECGLLSASLKAKAQTVYDEQAAYRKKNSNFSKK